MAKVYTAQEIRRRADEEERHWHDHVTAAMLRQAADAMEREANRKNSVTMEYCFVENDGCRVQFLYDSLGDAKRGAARMGYDVKYFIRREIGQWEEVKDGE